MQSISRTSRKEKEEKMGHSGTREDSNSNMSLLQFVQALVQFTTAFNFDSIHSQHILDVIYPEFHESYQ